jgi:class 3 adenylate cyclase
MTEPATILVVDDTRMTVELVREVLLLHGYRVVEAFDGLEALEKIQHEQPDLLILDVNMPRMDGYEVCRRVKTNPATAHIPVLMLSAMESVGHRVRGLSLGAEDYVIKPFRPAELAARVEAHLRTKREVDALRLSEEAVLEQEGTLDKFSGDSVMAIFGAPLAQTDHSLRAVRSALTIRRRLAAFECDATADGHLHYKIGICSGEAVVGNAGMPDLMNYTAIGDTVNVAKRLEESAAPDQILLGASTYDTVKIKVNARALGSIHLKGRSAPVRVYELLPSRALE